MEALFDAPSSSNACASVADLQEQLRTLLDSKVKPTKAEHVTVTFELRSNVTFAVPVTETEHASLEAGVSVDPRLAGGVRAGSTVMDIDGQIIRHINALDTVLGQSQDDPVPQRIVAKHIMAGVGDADLSQWVMRSMARGTQGWTFTYGCKNSAQTWARQHAKTPARTAIGEWSNKDGQDTVNLSRPAFDCRGTLTVAFSKSEKAISVKYEHTNMHKTVGELLDLLAPPPPRPQAANLPENRKPISKKTSKRRQAANGAGNGGTPGEEGATPRPRKRKKSTQDGEPSTQKKRPRKKKNDGDAQIDPTLVDHMLPPEMPGARPVGDAAQRLYNTQAQQDGMANGSAYPDGLVNGDALNESEAQAVAMVSSSLHAHSILNLVSGVTEKRRETAIRLLAEANVDPETLTPEQFSIFAGQSPALQEESLAMIVEFGADRLKITFPPEHQNASEENSRPSHDQTVEQAPADNSQQLAKPTGTPRSNRQASRKKMEAADMGAGEADDTQADAATRPRKARAPKLSRGSCTPCRSSKAKCGKGKPSCGQCLESGTACSYPLEQSRKSKAFEEEEAEEAADEGQAPQLAETVLAAPHEEDEPDELPSPGSSYEDPGAPAHQDSENQEDEAEAGSEPGPMQDDPQSTYAEPTNGIYHHSSGLTFPDSLSPEVTQQMWNSGGGTDYFQQKSIHGSTNHGLGLPQQAQAQEQSNTLSFPEPRGTASTSNSQTGTHHQQKSWGSYTSSQRSGVAELPSTTSSASANMGHTTTSWPAYSAPEATSTKQASASPRQSRRAADPSNNASYSAVSDGMHHVSALAQAAINSAAARTASPVQNTLYDASTAAAAPTLRAKSRQSMRPQMRTPVPNASSRTAQPQRSALPTAANPSYSATGAVKTAATNYNNSYSQYSTNTDQSSNGVAYQPYSQETAASTTTISYPNYDSYRAQSHSTSNTLPHNNAATQQVASSYTTSTPSTASQWRDTSSSQTRNPVSYTSNSSTTASPSVNMRSSTNQRSQIPSSFKVRPQAPTQPQATYPTYPSQPQPQPTSSQQQGWYTGSSSTASYTTNTSRPTGGANNNNPPQYGQQPHAPAAHRAMNLSGHTYSSMEGGDPLYSMLPGGSGH